MSCQGDREISSTVDILGCGQYGADPLRKHELMKAKLQPKIVLVTKEAIILLLYMAVSAMVLDTFMQTRSLEEGSPAFGLEKMLEGTAQRPFVYRQLVPVTVNSLVSLIPEEQHEAFVEYHLDRYHLKQMYFERAKYPNINKGREQWTPTYSLKFHLVYLFMFASLLACIYCMRWLQNAVFARNDSFYALTPILFMTLLPLSFVTGNFYYDFPELFFLSILLLTAVKGWYGAWIILLPLAVFNKESNLLVPLLYISVIVGSLGTWRNRIYLGLSIALSAIIYIYIKMLYVDNPGGTVIFRLSQNVDFWLNPKNYFLWQDFFAPLIPFPRGMNIIWIALIISTILVAWRKKPIVIKWLFVTSLVVNVPLFILFCHADEMRNLSFVFIPLFLLVSHSLQYLFLSNEKIAVSEEPVDKLLTKEAALE